MRSNVGLKYPNPTQKDTRMYVLIDTEKPNDTRTFESLDALKEWVGASSKVDKASEILSKVKELLESIQVSEDATVSTPTPAPGKITDTINSFYKQCYRTIRRDDPKTIGYTQTHQRTIDDQFNTSTFTSISIENQISSKSILPESILSQQYIDTLTHMKLKFIDQCMKKCTKNILYTRENEFASEPEYITACLKLWILHPDVYSHANTNGMIYNEKIENEDIIIRIYDNYYVICDKFTDFFSILHTFKSLHDKKRNVQNIFKLLHHYYNNTLTHQNLEMFVEEFISQKITSNNTISIKSSILYDSFLQWIQDKYNDVLGNITYKAKPTLLVTILEIFTNKRFTIMFEEMTGLKTARKSDGNYWQDIGFISKNETPFKLTKKSTPDLLTKTDVFPCIHDKFTEHATVDW